MASLTYEVGAYLQAQSVGTVATNIFEGWEPDEPAGALTLFARPGLSPIRAMARTTVCEMENLQVLGRDSDYETLHTKMRLVLTTLRNFQGTLGASTYLQITPRGTIIDLGADERMRFRASLNFGVMRSAA